MDSIYVYWTADVFSLPWAANVSSLRWTTNVSSKIRWAANVSSLHWTANVSSLHWAANVSSLQWQLMFLLYIGQHIFFPLTKSTIRQEGYFFKVENSFKLLYSFTTVGQISRKLNICLKGHYLSQYTQLKTCIACCPGLLLELDIFPPCYNHVFL